MREQECRHIDAKTFASLDWKKYTLLDLREPDEVLVDSIPGSYNLPLSKLGAGLDDVPKGLPVIVFCQYGDLSEQVVEILTDRGYDALNLDGGFRGFRKYLKTTGKNNSESAKDERNSPGDNEPRENKRSRIFVDARGMKCPGPIVKVGDAVRGASKGDIIEIDATEDSFISDISVWCERTGNILNDVSKNGEVIHAEIIKGVSSSRTEKNRGNEKTFVIFSGELDKVMAAFIMANAALSMNRKVTMYFTFWGLNVLRKNEKMKVKKDLIGKLFGAMMPRGTKKLGLSRMNMLGFGARMIRSEMKKSGIPSLEEMIESAISHGVRIIACQMSMDIMKIRKEELIDGVETGGAATMLGSAEKSDLTYFI